MTKKAIFLLAVTICWLSLHAETFDKYVGYRVLTVRRPSHLGWAFTWRKTGAAISEQTYPLIIFSSITASPILAVTLSGITF